jgi:hypothetical protein
MAFCTQCGSPVEGAFCTKCGAKIVAEGSPAAAPQPQAQQPPPPPPLPPRPAAASPIVIPAHPAPARKGRVLFWALGGCLVVIVIIVVALISAGVFIAHKTGLDIGLMQTDPNLAVAKMLATTNPNLEVLSVDKESGIIRVREKSTGREMALDLKDVKNGKIVFMDDTNRKIEIQSRGEGDKAALEIRSDTEGEAVPAEAGAPQDVLPVYPGATGMGPNTLRSKDSLDAVGVFYEKALKEAGYAVQKSSVAGTAIRLSGTKDERTAEVSIARMGTETIINLGFNQN